MTFRTSIAATSIAVSIAAALVSSPSWAVEIRGRVVHGETGVPLDGFLVTFAGAPAAKRATVAADGSYVVDAPTATTELVCTSSTGVFFDRVKPAGGRADFQILGTGFVYAAHTGTSVAGVRLRLVDDATGAVIPAGLMGSGQQDQVTDKHGLYRFDVAQVKRYRLEVTTDGLRYHAPSLRIPPQDGVAVFDPRTGLVAAPAAPSASTPSPYWLRMDPFQPTNGSARLPGHNHVPVDAAEAVVTISKTASKGQVSIGDIVTYTIRVENRSATDLLRRGGLGGVVVRDVLPSELRLVGGSARLQVDGKDLTLASLGGPQLLTFRAEEAGTAVALDLKKGGRLVIRYQAVVGVHARGTRLMTNRAQVMDPAGVPLSAEARAEVRLVPDQLFDLSWIRGRVYCDYDGDGWAGANDPGIYGARVYVDTGRFAVTDRDGKFHLSDIPPGLHMVKVDTDTVPPGSAPTTPISRSFHLSRGMPQQVSFGFKCALSKAVPGVVVPAKAPKGGPVREPRLLVSGKVGDLSLQVDGRPVGGTGVARLSLGGAEAGALMDVPWGPRGFDVPMRLRPGAPAGVTSWRVWVEVRDADEAWVPLRALGGTGAPREVTWDGTDGAGTQMVAVRGGLHRARLEATDGLGSRWTSAPVYFTVGRKQAGPVRTLPFQGIPVTRTRPSAAAVRAVRTLGVAARRMVGARVLVVMSVGARPSAEERESTRKSGRILAEYVRARLKLPKDAVGVSFVAGKGDGRFELYDRGTRKDAKPPKAPPAAPAQVRVAGMAVTPAKGGGFVSAVPAPKSGMLVVEVRNADGAAREVVLRPKAAAVDPAKKPTSPFGVETLRTALERKKKGQGPPAPLAVAGLRVDLPPNGAVLGQPLLPIQGTVPPIPGIQVTVNGTPVPVRRGAFEVLLPLPSGKATDVIIAARDPKGNVARVERRYTVKGNAMFLMVLADGALGQGGTKLDGWENHTTITKDSGIGKLVLHGRGVLYLKARVNGGKLADTIRFTAYADTARRKEFSNFLDQIIDPARSYPIYGDASKEGSDARSRGPYYVAIEADASRLVVGSFRPSKWGIELFSYSRVMEGAYLKVQKEFKKGWETVVESFVSFDDERVRRGHAVLRGTGGSYYFLPDKEIVEGSEQVAIAIYDRDTGGRLSTVPQMRDLDYRIDYLAGRVTFKRTIPSRVDSGFMTIPVDALAGRPTLDGHEVRILVDYETRAVRDVGDVSWGVYGRQTFAKYVTVGGGYVREGHGAGMGPDYELWGTTVTVDINKSTRIEAELARSRAGHGPTSVSDDGGLRFRGLSLLPDAVPREGWGIGVHGETDIGSFLGKDRPFLILRADYRRQDAGFRSSNTALEAGSERGGGEVRWHITRRAQIALRHDTLRVMRESLLVPGGEELTRHLTTVQAAMRFGRWTTVLELQHALEKSPAVGEVNGGAVTVMVRYKITPRLAIWVEQQAVIGGNDKVIREDLDRFMTGFGLDIDLGFDVGITLGERVRWGGEDASVIGLRTKLSKSTSMYVEERLLHRRDTQRWVPATVLGSEERFGKDGMGRTYGEYQVGTTVDGTYNRAVLGLARRIQILPGLHADLGFERSHSEALGDGIPARDANTFSLGADYVAHDRFKLSTRFEARFESSDAERMQLVTFNRLTADLGKGVSLFGKIDVAITQNRDRDQREAETVEMSLGLVYRPLDEGFSLMLKVGRIVDMRPVSLDPANGSLRTTADVVAVEPIIELPLRLQLTPKFAYKHAIEEAEGLPKAESNTLLFGLRLAFHLWKMLDIAGEYRWLSVDTAQETEHGALVEIAATIYRYARIGIGYNFAHFDDDLFSPLVRNEHGFFVRVAGMY